LLKKNALDPVPLTEVQDLLRRFLMPPLNTAGDGTSLFDHWQTSGDWHRP
jgi:hypothetical protein